MTPQIEQLKELFELALSQPSAERNAFVRDACSGDWELESELSSLLEAHDKSLGFFEKLSEELIAPALSAAELDDQDDSTGTDKTVSHYEFVERIGGGGMGIVYKARDTRLGRTVALKFLPRRQASNPAARARLLAEARSASSLDHPNIGVVYEIAETADARQFIAMAWYDGETLKDKIRRGPLPVPEVVKLVSQLGSALAAAHNAGIVHRDVKPANVILTPGGSVKLVDFGIAKLMSAEDGEAHAAGTIAYMSPEQTRSAAVDARTDIWSLGVLLYEMLTGSRPFKRDTTDQLIAAIRNDEPIDLFSLRPEVPASLAQVVDTCLQKHPSQRFQSADDFSAAITALDTGDRSLTDHGITRHPAQAPGGRIQRTWIAIAGAALLVLVVAFVGYRKFLSHNASASSATAFKPVSVAVLSFADAAAPESERYLSVALPEQIGTELSRFGAVTVPGYPSTEGLAKSGSIQEAARESGASYVVTGTVSRVAGRAAMNIQLVDGRTGRSLWHRTYDPMSPDRARVVNEAAKEILASLGLDLTRREEKRLDASPTISPRAYDLYLRGRYAELAATPRRSFLTPEPGEMRQAQALYAQAKALDPNFAQARARLALSHMYSATSYDTTRARLDQARTEAEAALRLDSSMFEAHDALAQLWGQTGNQQKSLDEMEAGLRSAPNNIALLFPLGLSLVRAGRWEEGIARLERLLQLDPRNPPALSQIGVLYGRLRKNDKAMAAFNRLLRAWPDDYNIAIIKGQCFLRWAGSADTLVAELNRIPRQWDQGGMATYGWYTAYRTERKFREGLAMLERSPTRLSFDRQIYHPRALMRAELYEGLGDTRLARTNYDSARAILVDSVAAHPATPSMHTALGLAYAGLGKKREALQQADLARALVPVSSNSVLSTAYMGISVEIFAHVGELDRAFETIELMMSMPAGREMTVAYLRVWPGFDKLRGDPRFDQIVERYTTK
jgi:serine/threonine-protein kinase